MLPQVYCPVCYVEVGGTYVVCCQNCAQKRRDALRDRLEKASQEVGGANPYPNPSFTGSRFCYHERERPSAKGRRVIRSAKHLS